MLPNTEAFPNRSREPCPNPPPENGDGVVPVVDVTTVCAHVVLTFMAGCNWKRAVDGAIAGKLEANGSPAFDCDSCNFVIAGGLEVVAVPAFSWGSGTGRGLEANTICVVTVCVVED